MTIYITYLAAISMAGLANHLWQSTLFAAGVWLLTWALRRNQARIRYVLWMLASLKFLLPFSLLVSFGEHVCSKLVARFAQPAFSPVIQGIANPFPLSTLEVAGSSPAAQSFPALAGHATAAASGPANWLPLLIGAWACGTLLLAARWAKRWHALWLAARSAKPITIVADVPVLSTATRIEPGVFGILDPVLLLPEGITERLTTAQLDAVVAHEMCHLRWRDNLTSALHMAVEALFWFNPVVWGIGSALIDERERACDEAVVGSRKDALAYAESILHVCKFCVEAPLPCVSGVTGSDLKKRIRRIMAEQVVRRLDLAHKIVLGVTAILAVGVPVFFGVVRAQLEAQVVAQKTDIVGTWQGTLHAGQTDLRTVLKIAGTGPANLKLTLYSIDQGGQGIPASSVSFENDVLKYAIQMIDGSYEGKMSADGNSITGTWKQAGNSLSLVLVRTTPATEWAIPEPPPKLPAMAADADPSFELATIKPSRPDEPGKRLIVDPSARFQTVNTTVSDLVNFAYNVESKQVVNAPPWLSSDKFDVDAKPDTPGTPNPEQLRTMLRKLLQDRFQFKFHQEKREMPAYVLTIAKNGPKLKKSEGDPKGLPGLFFRGQLGNLGVTNATMGDFTGLMQSAVLDRPVVDQTGLTGRWDFVLKWTPDESQFGGMGIKVPPPSETADAPPPLYTAIQEQIGLKLESTKAQVPVLVVDKLEKPSPN